MGTGRTVVDRRVDGEAGSAAFARLAAAFDDLARSDGCELQQRDYAVGGRVLRVRTIGPQLEHLFGRSLLPEVDGRDPQLTLDMWVGGPDPAAASPLVDGNELGERHGSGGERFAITADELYARYWGPSFMIRHGRRERRAVGWIDDLSAISPWNHARPWQALLVAWLAHAGSMVLHGAMVSRGGRGMLFVGPNGVGKSTVAAACLAAGLEFLSDDVVAVEADGGGGFAGHCIYPVLKLDRSLVGSIRPPGATGAPYGDPATDEVLFSLAEAPLARRSAQVVALALPALHERPETRFTPASGGQALRKLAEGHLSARRSQIATDFLRLGELAQGIPVLHCEVGRSARGIADAVANVLG